MDPSGLEDAEAASVSEGVGGLGALVVFSPSNTDHQLSSAFPCYF